MSGDTWPTFGSVSFDDTCRLVAGERTIDVEHGLGGLSRSRDDLVQLVRLSGVTDSRLQAQYERHPVGLDRTNLIFGTQMSRLVNDTFANPGHGTRFGSKGRSGVWYCAREFETAVAEVGHHRIRQLREVNRPDEPSIVRTLFLADVRAERFAHLDVADPRSDASLDPDSYDASQAFADNVRRLDGEGISYPSVRRPGGWCLAAFRAQLVSRVRRAGTYRLVIEGFRLVAVEEIG